MDNDNETIVIVQEIDTTGDIKLFKIDKEYLSEFQLDTTNIYKTLHNMHGNTYYYTNMRGYQLWQKIDKNNNYLVVSQLYSMLLNEQYYKEINTTYPVSINKSLIIYYKIMQINEQ